MTGKRLIYADEGTKSNVNASVIEKIGDEIENEVFILILRDHC